MMNRQYAKKLYTALEGVDPELLYDAKAYRAPKIKPYIRYVAAAVIVLAVISSVLILSAANAVKTSFTVDTNYGVTLELNADNRVVKATASASLYQRPAESCVRLGSEDAVAYLTDVMGERGGLNDHTNTLLFGVPEGSEEIADALIKGYDTEEYCVMRVGYDDDEAIARLAKKRRLTYGKAALLLNLSESSLGVRENRLFRLSANDIALLMEGRQVVSDGVSVAGKPLDGGYLTPEQIKKIAVDAAGFSPDTIVCEPDSDGFKLIYNVLLSKGDRGAAYILSAASGAIRNEFHGSPNTLRRELDKAHEEYGKASDNTPPQQNTPNQTPFVADDPAGSPSGQTAASAPTSATDDLPSATTSTQTDQPAVPTVKPDPTENPAETTSVPTDGDELPFVPDSTDSPTSSESMPPAPEDDAFLTARSIHATDMENTRTVLTGDCVSYAHREVTDYYEKNPYVILITNRAQLLKYWEVYPDMKADKYYQDRYLSDGWFDDHALLLATNTEYYVNVYCNSWYAFTKPGGILCVGYYDTRSDYDYSFDRKYEIPNSVTFGIEVERNLSNISSIQIMHLSLKETQSLSRVDYQPYTLPVTD